MFFHENTRHTIPWKKINFFVDISFRFTIILQFWFHFRGRRRFFPFNGVLFTQKISNEFILLCMDYSVALRLDKTER